MGYSPWGHRESEATEHAPQHTHRVFSYHKVSGIYKNVNVKSLRTQRKGTETS